jgi:hypothetical protein
MEWFTVVRTCRPDKPGVGLTRQSRCPERTYAYFKEASRERDIHWFNWQLRKTVFHIKNYRNLRKQWIYFLEKLWYKYRMHYSFLTRKILTYLPYDKLPHPRTERLIPIIAYDNLDYGTIDCRRICRMIVDRLVTLGYPATCEELSEMDVYLSYYSSSIGVQMDMDYFRDLYRILEAKKVHNKARIIYSHMICDSSNHEGYTLYNYNECHLYLQKSYKTRRTDHYFNLWVTQLTGEPYDLAKYWFNRMKRPSIKRAHFE